MVAPIVPFVVGLLSTYATRKAIDVVMGMTETNLVVQEINKVLGNQLRLK